MLDPPGAVVGSTALVIRTSLKSDRQVLRFLLKEGHLTDVSANIQTWVIALFRGIGMALRYTVAELNANSWITTEDQFRWHCPVKSPYRVREPLSFVHHVTIYSLCFLADRHGHSD